MSTKEVTVSIIMPVYKVEQYVGRAIESIQKQTLTDFEFLIVDDGTPDRSGEICEEYAAKDSRLKVIHKENGGAPSARNLAMKQACGKYTYFLDSDDWAEPTMLEDMVKLAEENRADLVVAGFYIDTYYSDTEYVVTDCKLPSQVFETQQAFRENAHRLFDCNLLYTPWNKLYRTGYLQEHGLEFPQTFWDDFPFNLSVVRDVQKVVLTDRQYYHFIRARAESETAKYRSDMFEKREEEHEWMRDLYAHWNVMNPEIDEFLQRRYIERLVGCIENLTNRSCTLPAAEKRRQIKQMITADKARYALKTARPRSKMMSLILLPLKWKNATLCYWESSYISKVKSGNVKRFATLKAKR